jgi:hypothetical protein
VDRLFSALVEKELVTYGSLIGYVISLRLSNMICFDELQILSKGNKNVGKQKQLPSRDRQRDWQKMVKTWLNWCPSIPEWDPEIRQHSNVSYTWWTKIDIDRRKSESHMITSSGLKEVRSVVNHWKTSLTILDMQQYIKSIVINQNFE